MGELGVIMAYDDDDLNNWLQSQASPDLTPQAPAAGGGGPGVWGRAREMMDRQAAMQYQPQDYSKYLAKSEPAPDRMGHDFRTILAMALDLFGNKGRGAGQLMAAGNQSFDAKNAAWKRENGPQAMLARQMQIKQLEGADRAQFNQDRSQIGAQIGQELQIGRAEQDAARDQRDFDHKLERDIAGDVQHQLDKEQQQSQFDTSQARMAEQFTAGQQLTREQMRQSAAQAAASRAQSDRHFQSGQDFTREQSELTRQHQAELAAARAQAAAQARADAAAARQPALDARLTREFNKDTEYEQSLAQLIDSADKITPKKGDIPGVGVVDGSFWGRTRDAIGATLGDKTSQQAERMTAIKDRLADLSQRMESGAAGPVSEEVRYQIQVGAQPGATESEFRTAMKLAREHVGGRLKRSATARGPQARAALAASGIDGWLGPEETTAGPMFDPAAYGGVLDEEDEEQ